MRINYICFVVQGFNQNNVKYSKVFLWRLERSRSLTVALIKFILWHKCAYQDMIWLLINLRRLLCKFIPREERLPYLQMQYAFCSNTKHVYTSGAMSVKVLTLDVYSNLLLTIKLNVGETEIRNSSPLTEIYM